MLIIRCELFIVIQFWIYKSFCCLNIWYLKSQIFLHKVYYNISWNIFRFLLFKKYAQILKLFLNHLEASFKRIVNSIQNARWFSLLFFSRALNQIIIQAMWWIIFNWKLSSKSFLSVQNVHKVGVVLFIVYHHFIINYWVLWCQIVCFLFHICCTSI